jgi:FKBP-type peptidyl-prolyl cis-trans isomerase
MVLSYNLNCFILFNNLQYMSKRFWALFIIIFILAMALTLNPFRSPNNRAKPDSNTSTPSNTTTPTYSSRLKDMSVENLPTSTQPFDVLGIEVLVPTNSDNSREVTVGDSITVNYRGWFASNGEIFDQSFNRGDSGFTFTVGGQVIQGWNEGVIGMRLGEIRLLKVPYNKAYGEEDYGSIPGKSDMFFYVELLKFNN